MNQPRQKYIKIIIMGYIGKKYGERVIKMLSFVKVTLPLFAETLNFFI